MLCTEIIPSHQHQVCLFLAQQLVLSGHIEIKASCWGPQRQCQDSLRRWGHSQCQDLISLEKNVFIHTLFLSLLLLSLPLFNLGVLMSGEVWEGALQKRALRWYVPCRHQLGSIKSGSFQIKSEFYPIINHFTEIHDVFFSFPLDMCGEELGLRGEQQVHYTLLSKNRIWN